MAWVDPTNVATGDVLTASKWNQDVVANAAEFAPLFTAWTSYSPTISQGASSDIAKTVIWAKYANVGNLVVATFRINITAAGTAGSLLYVTLPVAPATGTSDFVGLGNGMYFDASTGIRYNALLERSGAGFVFVGDWSGATGWGSAPNLAAASGDVISGMLMYEAA